MKHVHENWSLTTSDKEVLETITRIPINIKHDLPQSYVMSLPLGKIKSEFIDKEIVSLLKKRVIVKTHHEIGEFISPIFVTNKFDGGFRPILNFKKLNEHVDYEKFKMETLSQILCLIRPNDYMAKINIKAASYSILILEQRQNLLQFIHKSCLYIFTALFNGYTEGPRKFTKALRLPLAQCRKNKIAVVGYIDDLITVACD